MPKVSELARVTTREGAVWRACESCGLLAALPPRDMALEPVRCDLCSIPLRPARRGWLR